MRTSVAFHALPWPHHSTKTILETTIDRAFEAILGDRLSKTVVEEILDYHTTETVLEAILDYHTTNKAFEAILSSRLANPALEEILGFGLCVQVGRGI